MKRRAGHFVHVAERDTNDLDKAFRTVSARFRAEDGIVILGAGGLREDHFLGNGLAGPISEWGLGVNEKRKVFMRVDERLFYIFWTSGDFASVHERSTHGGRVPCFTSCAWA
ncbi:MAG: hypothetical protein Q4G65_05905 [bacterium]|nr:hypothetical protein [bacterium]